MDNEDLLSRYNYDSFIPSYFEPWDNFENSPPVGQSAPDFPLWNLEEKETSLSEFGRGTTIPSLSLAVSPDRIVGWRRLP